MITLLSYGVRGQDERTEDGPGSTVLHVWKRRHVACNSREPFAGNAAGRRVPPHGCNRGPA